MGPRTEEWEGAQNTRWCSRAQRRAVTCLEPHSNHSHPVSYHLPPRALSPAPSKLSLDLNLL